MAPPAHPKIYHIVHVDRFASIVASGGLNCDERVVRERAAGTTIGMGSIKARRLRSELASQPGLRVGACVPFYFCPRSVMLYVIRQANHPELEYRGGQGPIVHLEADLRNVVAWANQNGRRWAFTLSNAGSSYFEDRCDLAQLGEINWEAVAAVDWRAEAVKEGKQAEFLLEGSFPLELVERVGVLSHAVTLQVAHALPPTESRPVIEIRKDWYY
jgi:hypothetical protein